MSAEGTTPPIAPRSSLRGECFCAFSLTFVGAMGTYLDARPETAIGWPARAAALGMTAAAVAIAWAPHAPGLGNPSISLWLLCLGRLTPRDTLRSWLGAVAGGILGAALARGFFHPAVLYECRGGSPIWAHSLNVGRAIALEFALLSAMLVCLGNLLPNDSRVIWRHPFPVALVSGLWVAIVGLVAGRLTGGIANPARLVASAATGGFWDGHGAYWIAALSAALFAALVNGAFRRSRGL